MTDLSVFADDGFDPKSWINAACSGKPQDEPLDRFLAELEMRLQLGSEEVEQSLTQVSTAALRRVPFAQQEVSRLKGDVGALQVGHMHQSVGWVGQARRRWLSVRDRHKAPPKKSAQKNHRHVDRRKVWPTANTGSCTAQRLLLLLLPPLHHCCCCHYVAGCRPKPADVRGCGRRCRCCSCRPTGCSAHSTHQHGGECS